jgi:hypothetical protein
VGDDIKMSDTVDAKEWLNQAYRLKAAMYKAYFYGHNNLADTLRKQVSENYAHQVGDFDGYCHASQRGRAVYRTLEDMEEQGILSETEYRFCNNL